MGVLRKEDEKEEQREGGGSPHCEFPESGVLPAPPHKQHFNHLLLFGSSKTILNLLNSERKKHFQEMPVPGKVKRAFP